MSIVMNEYKWAENAIKEGRLYNKPYETLSRIARYYMYNGKGKKDVLDLLKKFTVSCGNTIPTSKLEDKLQSVVMYASKRPIYIVDKIEISVNEINRIKELESVRLQRLAFTLLCIAKFSKITNDKNDYWVNTPDNEIMSMANITTSIKTQSELFHQLVDLGMIRNSSKVDSLSVQVLFVEEGETAMEITDFRNVGYQYMNYINGGYYACESCGIVLKKNKRSDKPQKYCPDCAAKMRIKKTVESVMRKRTKS